MRMCFAVVAVLVAMTNALPMPQDDDADMPPMPYEFENTVSEQLADPNGVFWNQQEAAEEDTPGRVEGSYSVWQPDGRLMTVTYYVDGESGFVPTITYQDDFTPDWE